MTREDIEFRTSDGVTLRGWFYPSTVSSGGGAHGTKLPCLVMAHGFSALKEMALDKFAEKFTSTLPLHCLVYDNRGFGASDAAPGQPRQEIIPTLQCSDYSDAITYAATRKEVDPERIGVWGSSYSGGHVLYVGAVDKRVKAVISQVPLVNGNLTFQKLTRPDFIPPTNALFASDRAARARGEEAATIPVVDQNPLATSALPTADSYTFFTPYEKSCGWKNVVTVRSVEALRAYVPEVLIHAISPSPLFMAVARNDVLTTPDLSLAAYSRALEPKELLLLPGGHFDAYSGEDFEINSRRQVDFLGRTLCEKAGRVQGNY